jgi:hypothetical protein
MERTYRQGFETAQLERPVPSSKPPDAEDALDWVLIPPRPRSAFWTVCRFMLGRDGEQERDGHLVPLITERETPGWQLVMSDGGFEKAIGEKTIVPLVRLGLLENAGDGPKQLLISNRGRATWRLFLQRGGHYPEDLTQVWPAPSGLRLGSQRKRAMGWTGWPRMLRGGQQCHRWHSTPCVPPRRRGGRAPGTEAG